MKVWGEERKKRKKESLRTGDGDNLYSQAAKGRRVCALRAGRYKPRIAGLRLILTIIASDWSVSTLADALRCQVP